MKEIMLNKGYVVQVDDADFDWLNQWKWWAKKGRHTLYATRKEWIGADRVNISMHRQILGLTSPKDFSDHIDGNGLNNQRANLRKCTCAQNNMNAGRKAIGSSVYKGVSISNNRKGWVARIGVSGKIKRIGKFDTEELAAAAYNEAAKKYHGEFARLNDLTKTLL